MTRSFSYESGQSMVEFALVLVFLLALLAGVFDIGRAFFAYIIIRDAAQEGAVYGSIAPKSDLAGFKSAVADRVVDSFCRSGQSDRHSYRCQQDECPGGFIWQCLCCSWE